MTYLKEIKVIMTLVKLISTSHDIQRLGLNPDTTLIYLGKGEFLTAKLFKRRKNTLKNKVYIY